MGGIGEAHPKFREVLPPQRRLPAQLDLVGEEHDVPGVPVWADAPGGVGHQQGVTPQQPQHPHAIGHILIGVPLVVVHPALHHRHGLACQGAKDQLPHMSGGGGAGKVGNGGVGHRHSVLYLLGQIPQAGA